MCHGESSAGCPDDSGLHRWRLLFCKHKLISQEVTDLQILLEDVSYSCGTTFEDVEMPSQLSNVFVKDHNCTDTIDKLYYLCGFEPIFFLCASDNIPTIDTNSPQGQECTLSYKQHVRMPKLKS